jgi:uncharacterized membrane protein YvlD (DUF360 family)
MVMDMNKPWLVRTGAAVIANAVALFIAQLVLGGFDIDFGPFIIVAIVFTLATLFIKPVMDNLAGNFASGATWIAGLVTVFLGLVIANVLAGSGMDISGFWTWVWATLIVWVGTLIYDVADDRLIAIVKRSLPGTGESTA